MPAAASLYFASRLRAVKRTASKLGRSASSSPLAESRERSAASSRALSCVWLAVWARTGEGGEGCVRRSAAQDELIGAGASGSGMS